MCYFLAKKIKNSNVLRGASTFPYNVVHIRYDLDKLTSHRNRNSFRCMFFHLSWYHKRTFQKHCQVGYFTKEEENMPARFCEKLENFCLSWTLPSRILIQANYEAISVQEKVFKESHHTCHWPSNAFTSCMRFFFFIENFSFLAYNVVHILFINHNIPKKKCT